MWELRKTLNFIAFIAKIVFPPSFFALLKLFDSIFSWQLKKKTEAIRQKPVKKEQIWKKKGRERDKEKLLEIFFPSVLIFSKQLQCLQLYYSKKITEAEELRLMMWILNSKKKSILNWDSSPEDKSWRNFYP